MWVGQRGFAAPPTIRVAGGEDYKLHGSNSKQALSTGIMTPGDCEQCWAARKEAKELIRLRRDEFYAEDAPSA